MNNQLKFNLFLLSIFCLSAIQACSSSKNIVSGTEKAVTVSNKADIWIFPPTLNYESIQTESPVSSPSFRLAEVGIVLVNQSQTLFEQKGFQIHLKEQGVPFLTSNQQLDLFRPIIPENLLADLHTLSKSSSPNILVLDLKVKVGTGGSWDPYSGAITSKNHNSRLRAVIIDGSEGKVLWRNEVQLRDIPSPNKKNFLDAIQILFQTLK